MFSWPLLLSLVALGVAGWAVWFMLLAVRASVQARDELRAGRLELVRWQQRAADEEAARMTALQLLDDLTVRHSLEMRTATARLEALEHKYGTVLQLYRDSLAIDGPLASRRVQ